ncbi:MAG: glycosyltransferase family 2 protein [Muribaculaceae bacterium]
MKLSIITINYNNCEGLRRTIESVVNQTCRDFEYIIIDGGSTDGSVNVIKQYASQIDYWMSEPDKGIYNAMNKGTNVAHGEYCLFLNSGDSLRENSTLAEVYECGLDVDIVCGSIMVAGKNFLPSPKEVSLGFFYRSSLNHPAAFIRRELLDRYPYDESLKICADRKFFIEALIAGEASYKCISTIVSDFEGNGISSSNIQLRNKENKQVLQSLFSGRILVDYSLMYGEKDDMHRLFYTLTQWRGRKWVYTLIVALLKIIMLNRGWIKSFKI